MKNFTGIAAAAADFSFLKLSGTTTEPKPTALESTPDTAPQAAVSAGGHLLPLVLLILILAAMAALLVALFIQQQKILRILNSIKKSRIPKNKQTASPEHVPPEISSVRKNEQTAPDNTPQQSQAPSVIPAVTKENKDAGSSPTPESGQQGEANADVIPPAAAPLPRPASRPSKVCGLAMRKDVHYNPSTRIAFSKDTGSPILLELYSDNTIVPSQICFQSYNTAAFYQQNGFPHIFDFVSRNGTSIHLSHNTKLLQVKQPAEAVIASGKIYLQQKGILIAEERRD